VRLQPQQTALEQRQQQLAALGTEYEGLALQIAQLTQVHPALLLLLLLFIDGD
jgi:hypothetical protein